MAPPPLATRPISAAAAVGNFKLAFGAAAKSAAADANKSASQGLAAAPPTRPSRNVDQLRGINHLDDATRTGGALRRCAQGGAVAARGRCSGRNAIENNKRKSKV